MCKIALRIVAAEWPLFQASLRGVFEPLTARQHERLRRRNSPALSRRIFQPEISMGRGVQAKLPAKRQPMSNLQLNYRNMAREKTAAVRAPASGLRVSGQVRKRRRPKLRCQDALRVVDELHQMGAGLARIYDVLAGRLGGEEGRGERV